jgi:hypothetical protein
VAISATELPHLGQKQIGEGFRTVGEGFRTVGEGFRNGHGLRLEPIQCFARPAAPAMPEIRNCVVPEVCYSPFRY